MISNGQYPVLALVDVELFVSSGAPRRAFTVHPRTAWWSPTSPAFSVDDDALVQAGWQCDGLDGTLHPSRAREPDPEVPHPYALGPAWIGSNCWHAEFMVDDTIVSGFVDHRWAGTHLGICELGDEMASDSPWRWHVVAPDGRAVCGRAETPVLAAFAAENALVASGARIGWHGN